MFKFLKDKLKKAVGAFSKKVEEEAKPVEEAPKEKVPKKEKRPTKPARGVTETIAPEPAKKSFFRIFKKEKSAEIIEEKPGKKTEEKPEEKKGFFGKQRKSTISELAFAGLGKITEAVTKTSISESKFEELFSDLEIALLESNVAFEVVEKIKADLKKELVEQKVLRGSVADVVQSTLQRSVGELFLDPVDLLAKIKEKKDRPYVIAFVGVNGSGKTTTIAKMAHLLQRKKLRVVIAAADTFRAAAIQQLEEHANRLGVKLVKQDYGADPAAVGYDAINYAKAHNIDVVLIDTAGRQHANVNLMEEMKKIVRVCKPDTTIFIGESITGNDCVEQAREFSRAVNIDGIILTKADVDEKGGAFVSVSYITGKPILYVGMGQKYEDLKPFDKELVMQNLGIA